jgi:hypothetical protein
MEIINTACLPRVEARHGQFRPGRSLHDQPRRAALPWLLALVLLAGVTTGCRTYTTQSRDMTSAWAAGDAAAAARAFGRRADQKTRSKDAVIWHLEAGAASRAAGGFEESNRHFAAAAERMDEYERKAKVRLGTEAAAIFSNQQNLPYEGRTYDKIMLHTYKALNYLVLEQPDRSRPELIRAYQRQQDAVAENKRRIEAATEAARNSGHGELVERTQADPAFNQAIAGLTRNLEGFKFYADYVNPFTVYLDGLYFLHAGSDASDRERALLSLRRVAQVAGNTPAVAADLALAEAAAAGRPPTLPPQTYVIFETGRAASREQVRIDIPILVADVSYVGAAFPQLVFHGDHAPSLTVGAGGARQTTGLVASMDAIIAQDFKDELPAIITKTLISTVAKAAAGWAVSDAARRQDESLGVLARLVTAAVQAAMNIADTRSWTTLPKEFQVSRVNTPASRSVTLTVPGRAPVTVALIDGVVNVVYVKSVRAGGPLWINQFRLK